VHPLRREQTKYRNPLYPALQMMLRYLPGLMHVATGGAVPRRLSPRSKTPAATLQHLPLLHRHMS
jgi:hypothetical protein